jgi:hypothetical protein
MFAGISNWSWSWSYFLGPKDWTGLDLKSLREVRVRVHPPPHAHGLGSRWATSSPSVCFSFLYFPSFLCPFCFCFVSFCFVFFSVLFCFVFSPFFWRLLSTVLPLQAPPSFAPVHPHPSSRLFSPRLPRSLATKRITSGWVFSRFSLVRLSFSLFSRAHAFPTPFCINGDALSCKKKSKQ